MKLFCSIAFVLLGIVNAFYVAQQQQQLPLLITRRNIRVECGMSITAAIDGSATMIHSILKKPSKILTVGVEYAGGNPNGLSSNELSILSMQLRNKSKVSAIWCQDMDAVQEFASEQQSAQGNFPGPCPIIYFGPVGDAELAVQAGASAVVLSAADDWLEIRSRVTSEIIWKVTIPQDIETIQEKTNGHANVFWVEPTNEETELDTLVNAIPTTALWIAAVESMQPNGAEIAQGKTYKTRGCGSILVRKACVGDLEDTEYAQFCVSGFTSKASSEFKFSGLTGSTNGHFGGIQSNSSIQWKRLNLL